MPDIIELVNKLKSFAIFEGMGVRELHAIGTVISLEQFLRGDVIIKEGEDNSSIYLVVSGIISIYSGYGTDEEVQKAKIGAGSFLGGPVSRPPGTWLWCNDNEPWEG